MSNEENVFLPKSPWPSSDSFFFSFGNFQMHYVTTAFFQNSPSGTDLSRDWMASLKSKVSCQHILMAFFWREDWWCKWPEDAGIMHVFRVLRKFPCFHCGVVGRFCVDFDIKKMWGQHPASPFPIWVILGKWLNLSEPLFLHLWKGDNSSFTDCAVKIKFDHIPVIGIR